MNDSNLSSMSQLKNFLSETEGIEFNRKNRKDVYSCIEETLIRTVDELTQWEVIGATEKITEEYLLPSKGSGNVK